MQASGKCPFDAFKSHRENSEILDTEFAGEPIKMVLGYKAVRQTAKDWQTFSSNGKCKVPVPSEEGLRTVQQFPIETDPDEHKDYRDLIESFFPRTACDDYCGVHL